MKLRRLIPLLGLLCALAAAQAPAQGLVDASRGSTPIDQMAEPPLLGNAVNNDEMRPRNYPMQPPTIPHRVDGYQIDKNFNKCLDCHARDKTAFSQAVPVSVTHYIGRDGNVLPKISTRRYFCMQCHVPQDANKPLVGNSFENAEQMADKPPTAKP